MIYVSLLALPLICIKYTAQGESQVANIAQGKAKCYICHETLTKSCILSYKQSGSALSVLLYYRTVVPFDPPMQNTINMLVGIPNTFQLHSNLYL